MSETRICYIVICLIHSYNIQTCKPVDDSRFIKIIECRKTTDQSNGPTHSTKKIKKLKLENKYHQINKLFRFYKYTNKSNNL